jgi:hypothetical protein
LEFDFLGAVDGFEGGFDGVGVGGAEEFSTGLLGDHAEGGFVEIGEDHAAADAAVVGVEDGHGDVAVFAGADGVDRDAAGFGEGGGLVG